MLNQKRSSATIAMIDQQHLGHPHHHHGHFPAGLLRPAMSKPACDKIYDKITRYAEKLVQTGEDIENEFGIPIVNKRISVTPIATGGREPAETEDYVPFAAGPGPGGQRPAASTLSAAIPRWCRRA